jgi:hypothetical protein
MKKAWEKERAEEGAATTTGETKERNCTGKGKGASKERRVKMREGGGGREGTKGGRGRGEKHKGKEDGGRRKIGEERKTVEEGGTFEIKEELEGENGQDQGLGTAKKENLNLKRTKENGGNWRKQECQKPRCQKSLETQGGTEGRRAVKAFERRKGVGVKLVVNKVVLRGRRQERRHRPRKGRREGGVLRRRRKSRRTGESRDERRGKGTGETRRDRRRKGGMRGLCTKGGKGGCNRGASKKGQAIKSKRGTGMERAEGTLISSENQRTKRGSGVEGAESFKLSQGEGEGGGLKGENLSRRVRSCLWKGNCWGGGRSRTRGHRGARIGGEGSNREGGNNHEN